MSTAAPNGGGGRALPPSPSNSEHEEDGFVVFSPPNRTTASSSSLPARRVGGAATTAKKGTVKRRSTLSGAIPSESSAASAQLEPAPLSAESAPLRTPGPSRDYVILATLVLSYMFPKRRRWIVAVSLLYLGLKWCAVRIVCSKRVQASVFHAWPWMTTWPPCDFSHPMQTQPFPYLFQWLDALLPEAAKSFRGLELRTVPLRVLKRRSSNSLAALGAWHVSPPEEKQHPDKSPSVVLYIHGRGSHRGARNRVELYEHLGKAVGVHTVCFDPRGSGDSYFAHESTFASSDTMETNKSISLWSRLKKWWRYILEEGNLPNERRLLEDAHAVWQTVVTPKNQGGLGFEWSKVMLWGQGTGACAAANLCLHLVRRGTPPAGIVLETPFTSASDLLISRLKPYVDVKPSDPMLSEWISQLVSSNRMELETRLIEIYARSAVPLLILAAEKDDIIPTSHGERLAAVGAALSASQQRVVFQMFPNASHDGIVRHPRFVPVVTSFLSAVLLREKAGKQRRGSSFGDFLG